nr:sulfotransferase domain-containing protein [Pseudohalocynthiibacter aestuariivivens]
MTHPSFHIVSAPRSGNHLVRTIFEAYSHRPTEGCLGIKSDPPIHSRKLNLEKKLITISDTRPIAFKAHRVREVFLREKNWDEASGLIFVLRDPVSAISSQLVRSGMMNNNPLKNMTRKRRLFLQDAVENYISLINLYKLWKENNKILVRFEDLISVEKQDSQIDLLLDFAGLDRRAIQSPIEELFSLGQESQLDKLKDRPRKQSKAKEQVSSIITYADVEKLLLGHM